MKNIISPLTEILRLPKVSIDLNVNDDEGKIVYESFNSRHPRLPFIRRKTIGVMLLNVSSFSEPDDYLKSVGGKNSTAYYSRRCVKEGYSFEVINPVEFQSAILEINNSQPERQGSRMSDNYFASLNYPLNENNIYGGIFFQNKLVAYIWLRIQGELVLVNRILGHAEHLKKGIMYLLFSSAVSVVVQDKKETKWIMYDTYFGAQEGLKLFKSRLGFKPYIVGWKK